MSLGSGQIDATQRRDLYGVVYALSGTLRSRQEGIPDAEIRWATRPFVGGPTDERYEHYFTLPEQITEELPFRLGEVPPLFPIPLSVRNLPFQHAESIFTTIVDEDYAWEGSEATLWVGYLKPGQSPSGLGAGQEVGDPGLREWEPLRTRGQLGSPRDVSQDGFTVPLLSRETIRRKQVHYPVVTREGFPNIDPADEGRIAPIIVGRPDSWYRAIRIDCGINGIAVGRTFSGENSLVIQTEHSNVEDLVGKEVYVHRLDVTRTVSSVTPQDQFVDGGSNDYDLEFTEPLELEIPRGALVQERKNLYKVLAGLNVSEGEIAFESADGRVSPVNTQEFGGGSNVLTGVAELWDESPFSATTVGEAEPLVRSIALRDETPDGDVGLPPFIIEALDIPPPTLVQEQGFVEQQPEFATNEKVEATKINIPTGPAGASAAFDGNEDTGASIPSSGGSGGNSITFTFPSITGGNFDNDDTTRSIIRFRVQGNVEVIVPPSTSIATVTGALNGSSYQFILPTTQDFDASVRFVEQGNGAIVYSVEWEHDLSKDIVLNRTQDVEADFGSQEIQLGETVFVIRPIKSVLVKAGLADSARNLGHSPFSSDTYPSSVLANLQFLLLERHAPDTTWDPEVGFSQLSAHEFRYDRFINFDEYERATEFYEDNDVRLNFVITEPTPWPELENLIAFESRSYAFYGPSGHELHYIQDADQLAAAKAEATFRFPGVPQANVLLRGATFERTSPADITNAVNVRYWRRWLEDSSAPLNQKYRRAEDVLHEISVGVFGERRDETPVGLDTVSPNTGAGSSYDAGAHARLIGEFIVNRLGFARTRFAFETAWIAHGLRRGSLIRVVFSPSPGVFRNVMCEVESLKVSPINSERRTIVARSVAPPLKGLSPAFRWFDLFEPGDTWADRITGVYDRWNQYFAVPPGGS